MEVVAAFLFLGSKITADCDCSHEIKRCLLPGRKAMTHLDSIFKSRGIALLTKVCIVSYSFSSGRVWTWELGRKEGWVLKDWCFWIVMLEKILESSLDCKEIKPINPKGNQPLFIGTFIHGNHEPLFMEINQYSLEGLMLKFRYFGHLIQIANSLRKTLMMGKMKGKRRRGWPRMRWLDIIKDSVDMSWSKL